MQFELIQRQLRALPEIAAWPDALDLVERAVHQGSLSVWDYPLLACQAVGASEEAAMPGAAAVFCSVTSIHLVDDLLDQDPCGDFHRLGAGAAANLALAFQAAGHRMLETSRVEPPTRAALHESLAAMALETARGQSLDLEQAASEEAYWRVVAAKTPPLFSRALSIGALLGGAPAPTASALARLGAELGKLVQVSDDAIDALRAPAAADWRRPGSNLALLFALSADHGEREEFRRLVVAASDDPAALSVAQRILLSSGALAYCAYHLLALWQQAQEILARLPLADPAPLERLLAEHIRPLHAVLRAAGVEAPEELRVS